MATEASVPIKSIRVAHLGGTSLGYQLPKPIVGSKATLVLIPPFGIGAGIFKPQVSDATLLAAVNLVVLEPIGQGISKTNASAYSAWDSAWACVQALDGLGIKKAFVLGESAGGWIAARMALYAPERIQGLIPVVTDLDNTGPTLIDNAFIAGVSKINNTLELLLAPEGSQWSPPQLNDTSIAAALGSAASPEAKEQFISTISAANSYKTIEDKERLRQAFLSSMTRDSLVSRLEDIKVPVLWIAGDSDPYAVKDSVTKQVGQIKTEVRFETLAGAYHLPTWTHAEQVRELVITFVKTHGGIKDARALREAVGMIDM